MVATPKYQIVRATLDDRERIVSFLRRAFFPYEPLNIALGSTQGPSSSRDIRSLSSLSEDASLLAVADDGSVLGVCLNGEDRPVEDEPFQCVCSTYARILHVVTLAGRRADVWRRTGAARALDVHVLAVDSAARGRGLGRALLEAARTLAKDRGYPLLTVTCTGFFSARLAQQLDMQCVYSAPYSGLVAEGLLPVPPPTPHTELKVFVQELAS